MDYADRIARMRQRCLERKNLIINDVMGLSFPWPRNSIVEAASLKSTENIKSWRLRRGILCRDRLNSCHFEIDEYEILAGRLSTNQHDFPLNGISKEKAEKYLESLPDLPGQTGHCEVNVSEVFSVGISGLKEKILREKSKTVSQEKKETLQAFLYALEGFSSMLKNAAQDLQHILDRSELNPSRKREMNDMITSCHRISFQAPKTFMDALHLIWFIDMGIMYGDNAYLIVPGHLDRTLIKYYEQDIKTGVIDKEKALFMIECLYVLINEFVPDGLAMSVMVGGRDSKGNDVTNELSYLCLEALRRTKLVYPTVGICWHENTPANLTDLAVDLIADGYMTPAFFGDDIIQRGLIFYGVPVDEACNYINSTCVEITPVGASNIWVSAPFISLCKILLDEIDEWALGNRRAEDFEEFFENYLIRLSRSISDAAKEQNQFRKQRMKYGGKPLQSVFTKDCITRHKDIDGGGAIYNWIENSFVGIANLVDSLHVIKEELFLQKKLTFKKMKHLLDSNYEEEEKRLRFLNSYPKYGHSCNEIDLYVSRVISRILDECKKYKMEPDASPYVPGAFCWIMHERLGRECGATPDGRKTGTPFADGGGPAQGREKNGPTATILSTVSWDHQPMIGGIALNMKFNKRLLKTHKSKATLKNLINVYLARGGFEVQINVIDNIELVKAKNNPENYRDLVVRIGGYTDYFVRLSPEMQDELVSRTEFTSLK